MTSTFKRSLPVLCIIAMVASLALPATVRAEVTPAGQLDGEALFNRKCSACHQKTGKGIPGAFPALAGDRFVLESKDEAIIRTVLNGRGGMPSFAASTDDATLAAILTYVRSSWGNKAPTVTAQHVAKVRSSQVGGVSKAIGN